ncbi:glycoside hydrolase family 25 protein [Elizabethkingia sp. JS20170427COW]|nr:glycoside hydrolase family 25 protein [Elizabethkingia sp. JS20170427COW]
MRKPLVYYYLNYIKAKETHLLHNSEYESNRIKKISALHMDKAFGMDISHYQRKEDTKWEELNFENGALNLDFIFLRSTMGESVKDQHFQEYWALAKEHHIIRGAYHFYRPQDNPREQALWYIKNTPLENGDLVPVLDIEKLPRHKNLAEFKKDIKEWLDIVEEHYKAKPILYTYYYFYRDYLSEDFSEYPLWLANYNDVTQPSEEYPWVFWQFTEKGIVKGINTKVDLNIFNGDLGDLEDYTLP